MLALFLAAGMGIRLRGSHDLPKGLIRLGNKTIIEESLSNLSRFGVSEALIVTGYRAEEYHKALKNYSSISFVHNKEFAEKGSFQSLIVGLETANDDLIIVESDLVYDSRGLEKLLQYPHSDATLVSGFTKAGDEVYVHQENNHLKNLSKSNSKDAFGEFVGITKLSKNTCMQLLDLSHSLIQKNPQASYDSDGLTQVARITPIYCCKDENLIWGEIDDLSHLNRVKSIYSKVSS